MPEASLHPEWLQRHPRDAILWLTALAMAVAIGMLALGGVILLDDRAYAWRYAEQASNNVVLALTRDIERSITLYDLSLQGAIDALARPDIDRISPETRHMALFGRSASAEYLGSLLVLDSSGNILASSTALDPPGINLSDRDYFKVHQQRGDVGLFISRPFKSRLRNGDASIAVSRRISRPDGSFGGVVIGAMRLAYFHDLSSTLNLGSAESVTLLRSDGRVIMHRPFRDSDVDSDLGDTPIFRAFSRTEAGTLVAPASPDGVERLYTFRHLPNLPLILTVTVSVNDIYAVWWRKAIGIGAVLSLLCGATVALCLLFRREILLRIEAERGLREAAEQLTIAATTDGLTGLANRRAFEERINLEWRLAIRAETSVALLMIDVDFFKGFNDRYGHVEGDRVLRALADCIACNVMRPADLGARYGGEEFVALLPGTEAQGAVAVAQRIRGAVIELDIPHAAGTTGHVTVSIGVAVACPSPGDAHAALVALADAALYEAKRTGRNRVTLATRENDVSVWEPMAEARSQAD